MNGCLENFSRHGHCYRFEMHPIPQMLNPPGEPIYLSLSRLNHQGPACEVHPDLMVGVVTCHLCWPGGHSPTGESQERARVGLRVSARSISQRASLLASDAS